MSLTVCTMPECQTTAGCKCNQPGKPVIVSPVVLAPLPVWHEWISPSGVRWIMPPHPLFTSDPTM